MNKVKVSLREIMEDDNHPLMLKWVDEFHSTLREKNPKLNNEIFRDSLTGKTTDSDSVFLGSNPGP